MYQENIRTPLQYAFLLQSNHYVLSPVNRMNNKMRSSVSARWRLRLSYHFAACQIPEIATREETVHRGNSFELKHVN
jgi:hypothetical protein